MIEKYFVHGCVEASGCVERVSDEDAEFFTVYERLDVGCKAVGDCTDRNSADALCAVLNDAGKQVQQLAAELSHVEEIHADAVFITDDDYEKCPKVARNVIRQLAVMSFSATDAWLNEVRAQGIHFAVNRMLAAWESGFINDTPAQAYDISGGFLTALEFLPNASPDEFKRDYADEVRSAIAARLRAGEVSGE